jgi:hypothetical protein
VCPRPIEACRSCRGACMTWVDHGAREFCVNMGRACGLLGL